MQIRTLGITVAIYRMCELILHEQLEYTYTFVIIQFKYLNLQIMSL